MKPGIYQNLKNGKEYKLHYIVKHSETLEDMVVYEALYNNEMSKYWVRPESLFKVKFQYLRDK